MKKAICLVAIIVFCITGVSFAQTPTLRQRITDLEERILGLEQEIDEIMPTATMSKDLSIFQDANDPTEPGDIKVVRGTVLELDDCDAIAAWSVHSGAGVTIALENTRVYEGTGSVKVTIPAGITAVVKCTGGPWNISTHKYLKASWFGNSSAPLANCNMHFGEAAYDQENMGVFTLNSGSWKHKSWDISAIAVGDRNAVTIFAVTIPNASPTTANIYIDYVYADPGPSQVKAFDGDRSILLYPKVTTGHYHGTGASLVVSLGRKGTPTAILFFPLTDAKDSVAWQTEFGTSIKNLQTSATVANTITVSDGAFIVEANANINVNTQVVSYVVMWDD